MKYLIRNDIHNENAVQELKSLIAHYTDYHVEILTIENQKTSMPKGGYPVISMDKRLNGDYSLQVSRIFRSFASGCDQTHPERLVESPESKTSLEDQFKTIPQGKYILFDDDSASGFTMQTMCNLLAQQGISIINCVTANQYEDFIDIIDASDFIDTVENNGGLVIDYQNEIKRYSYLSEHVNLETRAKLPNAIKTHLINN